MWCLSDCLIVLLFGIQLYCKASGYFVIPGLPAKKLVQQGDIMFGTLTRVYDKKGPGQCSDTLSSMDGVYHAELIKYTVDIYNANSHFYHNLSFGFAILDECKDVTVATSLSLAFLPQAKCPVPASDANVQQNYDVEAVIGSSSSSQSVSVSHVLGPAQVPLISFLSTSDILDDKKQFPYFLRTVPPDRFQFRAICSFIHLHGWTYVSVIYKTGSYGELGYMLLKSCLESKNICIALAHKASDKTTDEENVNTAQRLLSEYYNARVVVLISDWDAFKLIRVVASNHSAGHFIWIGTDAMDISLDLTGEVKEHLLGSFLFSPSTHSISDFDRYFLSLKLIMYPYGKIHHSINLDQGQTKNPWFEDFWQILFNCSVSGGTCDTSLSVGDRLKQTTERAFLVKETVSIVIDSMKQVLLSKYCKGLKTTAEEARDCITGPRMLESMKQKIMHPTNPRVQIGQYMIKQLMPSILEDGRRVLTKRLVAEYDPKRQEVEYRANITWQFHYTEVEGNGSQTPQSRCSLACGPQQATVIQDSVCCWLCLTCHPNDRLATSLQDGTKCQACPVLTWPEPATAYTTCADIQPTPVGIDSLTGALQTILALLGLLASGIVSVLFYRHRGSRVIKASSLELSLVMQLGISLGYMVMLTMLAHPTASMCKINFILYCITFTLLFGPLFLRTLRIFRLFKSSSTSTRLPRMMSSNQQLGLCFGLVFMQVVMCIVVVITEPEWRRKAQPDLHKRHVELTCHFPLNALYPFLVYNLLLVCACTYLAFKTRNLPENFNESRFITMCVSTTLVILVCFVPAYIMSSNNTLKMLMLALGSAMNHSVALIFLFLTKLYVVFYYSEAEIKSRSQRVWTSTISNAMSSDGHSTATAPRTVVPSAPNTPPDLQDSLRESKPSQPS